MGKTKHHGKVMKSSEKEKKVKAKKLKSGKLKIEKPKRKKLKSEKSNALVLLSSGIDSPVAAYLTKKKFHNLIAVNFDNYPFTDAKQLDKTMALCRKLGIKKIYIVPHGKIIGTEIVRKCNSRYNCILCRRMMFRVAEKIAEREKCSFLVTGENLGQVASQTLENLKVVTDAVKIPILRPLLCNDKEETKKIAAEIGTYETSIIPSVCCSHVPKHPVTNASVAEINEEEAKLNIADMVDKSIEGLKEEIIK